MCATDVPAYVIAYPKDSKPLLISVTDPHRTAWLPENPDNDYMIATNPTTSKECVTSPSLGYSAYVSCWKNCEPYVKNTDNFLNIYMYIYI